MYTDEQLLMEFKRSGKCEFCGSQRCDGSLVWALGCREYRAFVETRTDIKTEESEEKIGASV